jgi:MFS family permease
MSELHLYQAAALTNRRIVGEFAARKARPRWQADNAPMTSQTNTLSLQRILICGGLIVTLSMGIRSGFGLWLQPMTMANGWTREGFSFALALQNLMWGITQPFVGMIADRYGALRVMLAGAALYAVGIALMAFSSSTLMFSLSAGLLLGVAQSCTTYSVVYGVIGRNVSAEKRSSAMGIAAAAGSFGQFFMLPLERELIAGFGWQQALLYLSGALLLIWPLAFGLRERTQATATVQREQTIWQAVKEAASYRSFQLLMAGYFVCGFQVVFIGVHLPSYLKDHGLGADVAAWALALVGLFNVVGTYAAGQLGQRLNKRHILSFIYIMRSVVIAIFLIVPLTPLSVYVFASAIGLLWLSTIPPTNAVVVQMFGPKHFSMLSGFVFFSHQIGSFLGVWLGGKLYDSTGSYNIVWYLCIALGVFACLINLPVNEGPVKRHAPALA